MFAAGLTAVVAVSSWFSTRYYAATATVLVSPEAPRVVDFDEVSSLGANTSWRRLVDSFFETQYGIMQSDSVLGEAVRRLREEQGVVDFDGLPDPAAFLRAHLTIAPRHETELVDLRVTYPDRDKAALFANTVAEVYTEWNVERVTEAEQRALGWLREQQAHYRQEKRASEERVMSFQHDNDLVTADDGDQLPILTLDGLHQSWSQVHATRIRQEAKLAEMAKLEARGAWMALADHFAANDDVIGSHLEAYRRRIQERDDLAARYLDSHPKLLEATRAVASTRARVQELVDREIDGRRAALALVVHEEEVLSQAIDAARTDVRNLGDKLIELALLESDAERNAEFFENLDRRATEVGLARYMHANNVQVLDPAKPGGSPVRPRIFLNTAAAAFLGLLGGIALAFFQELTDLSVKGPDDFVALGVAALPGVPRIEAGQRNALPNERSKAVFAHAMPRSSVAEALRSLRTQLRLASRHNDLRTVVVTSAFPLEGKSFVSANLGAIAAMGGARVLVVDGDLRRPSQHTLFGVAGDAGVADVLRGGRSLADVVVETHVPGLHLLPAGRRDDANPGPTEALDPADLHRLLAEAVGYDLVIIDTSPVGIVADGYLWASVADGSVFVVECGRTRRAVVGTCCDQLRAANPNLLGALTNKVRSAEAQGYGYGYRYRYYADEVA